MAPPLQYHYDGVRVLLCAMKISNTRNNSQTLAIYNFRNNNFSFFYCVQCTIEKKDHDSHKWQSTSKESYIIEEQMQETPIITYCFHWPVLKYLFCYIWLSIYHLGECFSFEYFQPQCNLPHITICLSVWLILPQ
jgi:hypothetical protein